MRTSTSERAGTWRQQVGGHSAFVPRPLPPTPELIFSDDLLRLLAEAHGGLGRLDGIAAILPNPDLFVAMYVRQEAVLSSQIEGTQSTLGDVLAFEADSTTRTPEDVAEVVNYVKAMNHGLDSLPTLPLSLRLLREIHELLLSGTRGHEKNPGEFRTSQNWIGPSGCTLLQAQFVPPPPDEVQRCLAALEEFLHDTRLPTLVHVALAHAQFETIHPFLDGNGRVGRLLIALLLCERKVLRQPLLYLSTYLKAHREEYYDRLTAIRLHGDWEGWLAFFLQGVVEVSEAATVTARSITELRETMRTLTVRPATRQLIELLFKKPYVNATQAAEMLNTSFATANSALAELEELRVVREVTGQQRNRLFRFEPYLAIFESQAGA